MQPITVFPKLPPYTDFSSELSKKATLALENGQVLFFPELSFDIHTAEQCFLSPTFVAPKSKNISFEFQKKLLKGAQGTAEDLENIREMTQRFYTFSNTLVQNLFPHYKNSLQSARTSFRPIEISNRKTSYRKDDKRLHVDAFPSTPNQGQRILRVFSNIHPKGENRVWRLGEPFEAVASRFLPTVPFRFPGSGYILNACNLTKSFRTHYDHIMLHMHDNMKRDMHYQKTAPQITFRFPPGSTWIVQTDSVSHAAMSGQHLLEQTFYLPVAGMMEPEKSPLKILERMTGKLLSHV